MESGFDALLETLAELGAEGLSLPGVDEPMMPSAYVRAILGAAREEGWSFDRAWSGAINRLQPPAAEGPIDFAGAQSLREERALLEEQRGLFRAAFEGRRPTPRERAESVAGSWRREEASRRLPLADEAA